MIKIGYMGIEGSFSETAAEKLKELAGMEQAKLVPLTHAKNILYALQTGEISYGVLGVRNTSVGPVPEFVKTFGDISYQILAEYILPVHHCLFRKNTEISIDSLLCIASHPHALAQTRQYRSDYFPSLGEQEVEDTALAAEWLSQGILPDTAAVICSEKGGELWGLDLIARDIEDSPDNCTIFCLLKLQDKG